MKRRLQLMPEVLPAPTKVEPAGPSAVRARTMARLRALAAARPAENAGEGDSHGTPEAPGGDDGTG